MGGWLRHLFNLPVTVAVPSDSLIGFMLRCRLLMTLHAAPDCGCIPKMTTQGRGSTGQCRLCNSAALTSPHNASHASSCAPPAHARQGLKLNSELQQLQLQASDATISAQYIRDAEGAQDPEGISISCSGRRGFLVFVCIHK